MVFYFRADELPFLMLSFCAVTVVLMIWHAGIGVYYLVHYRETELIIETWQCFRSEKHSDIRQVLRIFVMPNFSWLKELQRIFDFRNLLKNRKIWLGRSI